MMKILQSSKSFSCALFFGALLVSSPFVSRAQTQAQIQNQPVNKGEKVEKLWHDNATKWAGALKRTVHASKEDLKLFLKFNQTAFLKDKADFIRAAFEDKMDAGHTRSFFDNLTKKYLPLYNQFVTIKQDYPSSLAEYTNQSVTAGNNAGLTPGAHHGAGSTNMVASTCNSTCYNLDFSNGTLAGWNAYYGSNTSSTSSASYSLVGGGPCGFVTRAAYDPSSLDYQVALMSGPGVDPVVGSFIPVTPPMGNYSLRLGDSTAVGAQVAIASNSFRVSGTNPVLTIQYAVVLQSGNHVGTGQPWFQMQVMDSVGNIIPGCGNYFVVDTGFMPGWQTFPYFGAVVSAKTWTTVFVPLYAYAGKCVTVQFVASDCYAGGHFGYAYVACSCGGLSLLSSSPAFCGQTSITLTAPPGAATYQWSGPCISGANNQQSCSVTCPGTYKVVVVSTAGPSCADTFSINIPTAPGPPPVPDFKADTVCAGTPTQFTNLSNPLSGAGVKFYWDFYNNGKYEDSTSLNPVWTFPLGGAYKVRLHEVNNGCGMDTTITIIVDSTHLPTMYAYGYCANQNAYFYNYSFGTGHYVWNFGDTNCPSTQDTSSLAYPTHVYSQPGTYTVTLSAVGVHCPGSATAVITIYPSPSETISMSAVCGSPVVTFQAGNTTNIYYYYWTFYGSAGNYLGWYWSTSSSSATYTFPSANSSYQVVLYAYSTTGFCPGIDTLKFTLGFPTAKYGLNPPSACLGRVVNFSDSSLNASGWHWDFGDPTSGTADTTSKENPTHLFSGPGTFTIKLVASSSSGCKDSITKSVTMNPLAVAKFTGDSVCLNDSTHFLDMSTIVGGTITGWSWNFGDPPSGGNNTSTLQNPAHKFTAPGTYTVTFTAKTAAGCDSTIKKSVMVYTPPVPKFTNTKACAGASTSFTDGSSVASGSIASWNWTFGDGGLSNVQNPSHTYPAAGTYNAVLVVSTSNGCTDSIKQKVRVNPNPVVSFLADTLTGCAPLCVNFTDKTTISSGSNTTWNWSLGATTSTLQNPSYCYSSPGIYTIGLTVTSDSGCTSKQTVNNLISVYGKPTASFNTSATVVDLYDPVVVFTSTSKSPGDTIVSWNWTFTDSTAMGPNVTRTFADTGTYCGTLKVTNSHGCVDSTEQCVAVEANFTLYIPDAFSPNNNGYNDVFMPKGMYIKTFDMYIFDRWGLLLFHSNDIMKGWNGTVNHNLVQEDTYVYLIKIVDTKDVKHSYLGKLTLLR